MVGLADIADMNLQKMMTTRSNYYQVIFVTFTAFLNILTPLYFQKIMSDFLFVIIAFAFTISMLIVYFRLRFKHDEYTYRHIQALSVNFLQEHMYPMPYIPTDEEIDNAIDMIRGDLRFSPKIIRFAIMDYYSIYKP